MAGRGLNGGRRKVDASPAPVVGGESGAAEVGFEAPTLAAVAGGPGDLIGVRPGKRIVAPLPGNGVGSGEQPTADDDTTAGSGADDDAEDTGRPAAGPVRGLREREAIGIVGDPHRPAQAQRQVLIQGSPVQPDRVGIAQPAAEGGDGPRCPQPDAPALAGIGLDRPDQTGNGV